MDPEGLHESCLTSAWQCLVPALRAHEAQGGLRHIPTEAGQLWLAHIGPELHLRTESEAMKSLVSHHPSHTPWACSVFSAHLRVAVHTLALLPVPLSFVRLSLEAPHRCVPYDGGFLRQRWHSWGLVLWAVEFRKWWPGRCLVFLVRKRTRPRVRGMELKWEGGLAVTQHCHRLDHFWVT